MTETVDDKYTEGVWYDTEIGEYISIDRDADGNAVLCDPETGEAIYSYADSDEAFDGGEFIEVPERAQERPAEEIQRILSIVVSGSREINTISWKDEIGVGWARRQVDIRERE